MSKEMLPEDPMCIRCRRKKSEHDVTSQGLRCRTVQFFYPCLHERRTGHGMISPAGSSGESRCDDCGETFKW